MTLFLDPACQDTIQWDHKRVIVFVHYKGIRTSQVDLPVSLSLIKINYEAVGLASYLNESNWKYVFQFPQIMRHVCNLLFVEI